MANSEHLRKLRGGVAAWNAWRLENPKIKIDLRGAFLPKEDHQQINLGAADLTDANLSEGNYAFANFVGAILERTNFILTQLTGANFSAAELVHANFSFARLIEANLTDSNLSGAIFRFTELKDADLTGAKMGMTIIVGYGLDSVKGLGAVTHSFLSHIGIESIIHSRNRIPKSFLRGVGIPEDSLAIIDSLNRSPIIFYSCFISYSTLDQEFADRLYTDLQAKGVRCWFAPHSVEGGKKLHEQIDEAILIHDKVLLVLSEHSMKSAWVRTEIAKARSREAKEERRCLFPIRLVPFETLRDWECFDADTGQDSAREIREYFIPDFSNWKNHDSYQEALQRLIKDLKAASPASP